MKENEINQEKFESHFEMKAGIIIAVFTAVLAIAGLAGDSYGESILIANGEKISAYDWYSSKSIKQTTLEAQRASIEAMITSGTVASESKQDIYNLMAELDKNIDRYKKEKYEILVGSGNVSPDDWAQDVDGELGKVIGAEEWETEIAEIEEAAAKMDLADLWLEICLVIGAISLVMRVPRRKSTFLGFTVIIGLLGTFYTIYGMKMLWPF